MFKDNAKQIRSLALKYRESIAIPFLIGIFGFLYTMPLKVLNPFFTKWLLHGDSAQHYLGWIFFKNSGWHFPFGSNPNFGNSSSSTIVYSDSFPLLAIVLKFLLGAVHTNFQFFGIAVLLCFILQATISYRIFQFFALPKYLAAIGTVFLTITPAMLFRLRDHTSLSAQFLILIAIYLYLLSPQKFSVTKWNFLLVFTLGIQFYIFAMILPFYVASFLARSADSLKSKIIFFLKNLLYSSIFCLVAGFLYGYKFGSAAGWGFGHFKANLLALINSQGFASNIFNFRQGTGEYEGYGFLGLGLIGILAFSLSGQVARNYLAGLEARYSHLKFIIFLTYLFALTPNLGIGKYQIKLFEKIPLDGIFGILRSSGRFIWVTIYLVSIFAFVGLSKVFNKQKRQKLIIVVIATSLLGLQVIDGYSSLKSNKARIIGSVADQPDDVKELLNLAAGKKAINVYPVGNTSEWIDIAIVAAKFNITLGSVYLARTNKKEQSLANAKFIQDIKDNKLSKNVIWLIDTRMGSNKFVNNYLDSHEYVEWRQFKILV